MMQAAYTAKMGIMAQQRRVDTIADNLANVGTGGFKSRRVNFKDVLYDQMVNPAEPDSGNNLQLGHGVAISGVSRDFTLGVPENTGHYLDLYIDGKGFFMVDGPTEGAQYTRAGALAVSREDTGNYLVTSNGYYLLDEEGNRIQMPRVLDDLKINHEGELSITSQPPFAKLSLVSFYNIEGLSSIGEGLYEETIASGGPIATEAKILQGYLEGSNVAFGQESTQIIRAHRAFSLAGSALQAADEMDAIANRMRT